MTDSYNGIVANVTSSLPAPINIASSTNATPIVVATTTPHLLTSGDQVQVTDHTGNLAANGRWPIMVVDSTHVILVGSVGSGAGGSSGTVQSLNFGPVFQMPTDGQARDALSVDVALEALGDRTSSLLANSGRYKILQLIDHSVDDNATEDTNWSGTHTFAATNTWEQVALLYQSATGIYQANDSLTFDFSGSALAGNVGASVNNDIMLALYVSLFPAGGAPGSVSKVPGSGQAVAPYTTGVAYSTSSGVRLGGRVDMTNEQNFAVYLYGYTRNGSPTNVSVAMLGDWRLRIKIERPTDYTRLA